MSSIFRRLRLDELAPSSEMDGSNVSNSRISWFVVVASLVIQTTITSVPAIYGVVLSNYYAEKNLSSFTIWNDNISLAPLLMVAFWTISDPLTEVILQLATIPQLISLIGMTLLGIGLLATSYLASGGVAAYLASLSAGVVMGIGASLVVVQSDSCLHDYYVYRPSFHTFLRTTAYGVGLLLTPEYSKRILETISHRTLGLMSLSLVLIPAAGASFFVKSTRRRSSTSSPYRLLLSENIGRSGRPTSQAMTEMRHSASGATGTGVTAAAATTATGPQSIEVHHQYVSGSNNEAYSYDDPGEGSLPNYLSEPSRRVSISTGWRKYWRILKMTEFWAMLFSTSGFKGIYLFTYVVVAPLMIIRGGLECRPMAESLFIVLGLSIVILAAVLYLFSDKSARSRSLIFGCSTWISGVSAMGLTFADTYILFHFYVILIGLCIGGILSSYDSVVLDVFGHAAAARVRKLVAFLVGISLLLLSLIENPLHGLQVVAGLQFVGGAYWILVPILTSVQSRS